MKKKTETQIIPIANVNGNVLLTTQVGNGNLGGGNVKDTAGNVLVKGLLVNHNLGSGASLKGKTLIVTTNGLDINPHTDLVPVTQSLSGNASAPNTISNVFNADSDGVVSLVVTYTFQ